MKNKGSRYPIYKEIKQTHQNELDERVLQFVINTMSPPVISESHSFINLLNGFEITFKSKSCRFQVKGTVQ